jgi:hypothetical protein
MGEAIARPTQPTRKAVMKRMMVIAGIVLVFVGEINQVN